MSCFPCVAGLGMCTTALNQRPPSPADSYTGAAVSLAAPAPQPLVLTDYVRRRCSADRMKPHGDRGRVGHVHNSAQQQGPQSAVSHTESS